MEVCVSLHHPDIAVVLMSIAPYLPSSLLSVLPLSSPSLLSLSPPLLPSQAVDIRHIADKFPEKNGGLKDLFEKGPQDRFFLVKFWVRWIHIDCEEPKTYYTISDILLYSTGGHQYCTAG